MQQMLSARALLRIAAQCEAAAREEIAAVNKRIAREAAKKKGHMKKRLTDEQAKKLFDILKIAVENPELAERAIRAQVRLGPPASAPSRDQERILKGRQCLEPGQRD